MVSCGGGTPGKANEGKVIGFEVLLEDGMVVNACGMTEEQKDEFTAKVAESSGYTLAGGPVVIQDGAEKTNPYEGWRISS